MKASAMLMTLDRDFVSTSEVGRMLGVSVRTVQCWVDSGVLPAWRSVGGFRRISRQAVERLAEERLLVTQSGSSLGNGDIAIKARPLKVLVAAREQRSINECFDFGVSRKGALSIKIYPAISDLLLQLTQEGPDGIFLCSDDFDVSMDAVADAIHACSTTNECVPVMAYSISEDGMSGPGSSGPMSRHRLLQGNLSLALLKFTMLLNGPSSRRNRGYQKTYGAAL